MITLHPLPDAAGRREDHQTYLRCVCGFLIGLGIGIISTAFFLLH